MSMALNPQQFALFHGTGHPLQGDKIIPGRDFGHSRWGASGDLYGERSDHHAWSTPQEDLAWSYGIHTAYHLDHTDPATRARVHEVAPHPEMREGSTNTIEDNGFTEHFAPHFKTTGVVHDIMPGRQGTFPTINWQQFERRDPIIETAPGEQYDANHPEHPKTPMTQYEVPNMRPKSHPTLPLGDVDVKQWNGRMARQSVDEAVHDRTALQDKPYLTATPNGGIDKHREQYPNGVVTRR